MKLDTLRKKFIASLMLVLIGFVFGACGSTAGLGGSGLDGGVPEYGGDGGTNSLMVGWIAPTTNEDGTPLEDLAGYRLYYGKGPGEYAYVADVSNAYTEAEIGGLSTTTWYLTVTAYDYFGNESEYSNEISHSF